MEFAIKYVGYFTDHLLLAWPLLGFMALLIMTLGVIAGAKRLLFLALSEYSFFQ